MGRIGNIGGLFTKHFIQSSSAVHYTAPTFSSTTNLSLYQCPANTVARITPVMFKSDVIAGSTVQIQIIEALSGRQISITGVMTLPSAGVFHRMGITSQGVSAAGIQPATSNSIDGDAFASGMYDARTNEIILREGDLLRAQYISGGGSTIAASVNISEETRA